MRHTTWFNATMHINNFIMGLVASMEKQNSEDENFDASSITAVKASLMGPLSGIGDSFFWGILRVIAAGIGISLASTGSPLGAIVFLLLYNVPAFLIHYYALYSGYSIGESFIQNVRIRRNEDTHKSIKYARLNDDGQYDCFKCKIQNDS